ncbi:hypothetical protein EK21DRAFT_92970 [Setomelanomma holmii]|uniref:Uncharacterized protein n=1 Tax=Setomelanomma holmii TaxID=210430 RepID=A0A9P4LI14_9PLEO|nr:hypothetical protein EK21DRAFT_92970 [Setomelanomma holmii]
MITSLLRKLSRAISSTKRSNAQVNIEQSHATTTDHDRGHGIHTASSSGHSTPTVTTEITLSSRRHSFVVIPGSDEDFMPISVTLNGIEDIVCNNACQSLDHTQLLEHCVEYLFLDQRTTAFKHTHATLQQGFQILAYISNEWTPPWERSSDDLGHVVSVWLSELSEPDSQALYHVLSTLAGYSISLDVQLGDTRLEISIFLWALRLGPRGLAQGWEDGQTTIEALYAAEQQ